jgi:hypothetical protein
MTADQITSRLSTLAGKIALHILSQQEHPALEDTATASISGPLHDSYQEFSALIMAAMIWDPSKFRAIVRTNLDTMQPFSEPLPAQHWINALQQLHLSDEQMRVLCCLHEQHYETSRLQVSSALDHNMRQQQAHTDAFSALLQQQESSVRASPAQATAAGVLVQEHLGGATASGSPAWGAGSAGCRLAGCASAEAHAPVCSADMRAPAGAAGDHAQAGAGAGAGAADPDVQNEQLLVTQEALIQERQQLLRRWLLLGLHVGIVTACTLSTHQQVSAVVVTGVCQTASDSAGTTLVHLCTSALHCCVV